MLLFFELFGCLFCNYVFSFFFRWRISFPHLVILFLLTLCLVVEKMTGKKMKGEKLKRRWVFSCLIQKRKERERERKWCGTCKKFLSSVCEENGQCGEKNWPFTSLPFHHKHVKMGHNSEKKNHVIQSSNPKWRKGKGKKLYRTKPKRKPCSTITTNPALTEKNWNTRTDFYGMVNRG